MKNIFYLQKNIATQKMYFNKLNSLIGRSSKSDTCYVFGQFGIWNGDLYVKYPSAKNVRKSKPFRPRKSPLGMTSGISTAYAKEFFDSILQKRSDRQTFSKASENKISTFNALLLLEDILKKTSQNKSKRMNSSVQQTRLPDVPGAPIRPSAGPKVTESNKKGFESLSKKLEFSDPLEFFTQILNKSQCPDAPPRSGPRPRVTAKTIRELESYKQRLSFSKTMEHLEKRGRLVDITNKDADFLRNRRHTIKRVHLAGIENDPLLPKIVKGAYDSVPKGGFSVCSREDFQERYLSDSGSKRGYRRSGLSKTGSRFTLSQKQRSTTAGYQFRLGSTKSSGLR